MKTAIGKFRLLSRFMTSTAISISIMALALLASMAVQSTVAGSGSDVKILHSRLKPHKRRALTSGDWTKAATTVFDLHEIYDAAFDDAYADLLFVSAYLAVAECNMGLKARNREVAFGNPANLTARGHGFAFDPDKTDGAGLFRECLCSVKKSLEFFRNEPSPHEVISDYINGEIELGLQESAMPRSRMERYEFIHWKISYMDNWQAKLTAWLFFTTLPEMMRIRAELEKKHEAANAAEVDAEKP